MGWGYNKSQKTTEPFSGFQKQKSQKSQCLVKITLATLWYCRFSRVVNVSSFLAGIGKIGFDDLLTRKHYDRHLTYSNSKLMQILASNYLDEKCVKEGMGVRSYCVNPGEVRTEILKHVWFPVLMVVKVYQRIAKVHNWF
jgi:NAD(P)-dependent dehydrogenase (short-subunit alcohol dehydrogenase family)